MIPYLASFILSSVLFQLGGLAEFKHRNMRGACLLYSLAFLPLCILAGARDLSVGTDTGGYGIFLFNQGLVSTDYTSYVEALDNSVWDIAPLYAFGSYIIIKVFQSQVFYFAAIAFFAVFPVFFVCRKICPQRVGISMLMHLLIFFIPSLNMMRQSVSIGLTVLAVYFFVHEKRYQAAALSLCAILTHYSALIVALFCLIWFAAVKRDQADGLVQRSWAQPILLVIVLLGLIGMLFFRQIAGAFSHLEGFGRLFLYASHDGSELSSSGLVYDLLLIVGSLSTAFYLRGSDVLEAKFYGFLVSLSFVFFYLSGIDNTISRMMDFCTVFCIPLSSIILKQFDCRSMPVSILVIIGACLFRFLICYVFQGFGAAVPYTSSLLGI